MELSDILEIGPGLTALIGGGGKTTLLYTLGGELSRRGRTIVCTTTKIFPPSHIPCLLDPSPEALAQALQAAPLVCVGALDEQKKLRSSSLPMGVLLEAANYVIAEADGAKCLPLKAHGPHEPVIPRETRQVIAVAGLDGVGRPIRETVHRPEIFAALAGCAVADAATPERVAAVLEKEGLHQRVLLNKTDIPGGMETAAAFSGLLRCPTVVSALQKGEWKCLW